jgi:hypothetical protein
MHRATLGEIHEVDGARQRLGEPVADIGQGHTSVGHPGSRGRAMHAVPRPGADGVSGSTWFSVLPTGERKALFGTAALVMRKR